MRFKHRHGFEPICKGFQRRKLAAHDAIRMGLADKAKRHGDRNIGMAKLFAHQKLS